MSHLLADEFRFVLNEFNIFFDTDIKFDKFLIKYDLKKHTDLVDYEKFLQIFQDHAGHSPAMSFSSFGDKSSVPDPNKSVEKRLVEFFHGANFLCYTSFKEATMDKSLSESNVCSPETLRKLIEQRFGIFISNGQFDRLLGFLNKLDEAEKGLVNWTDMFKKFSEIK